jgi:AbrB family looped-hinge helix DNA binding protein
VKITSKGQVTIPKWVREAAGLVPGTEVEFIVEADGVRLVKANGQSRRTRGDLAIEHLRRNAGSVSMTTDELMALTRGDD